MTDIPQVPEVRREPALLKEEHTKRVPPELGEESWYVRGLHM